MTTKWAVWPPKRVRKWPKIDFSGNASRPSRMPKMTIGGGDKAVWRPTDLILGSKRVKKGSMGTKKGLKMNNNNSIKITLKVMNATNGRQT